MIVWFQLTNLDELFSYRLEAERNDCFQRLESKAAKERTAFALELTNTEASEGHVVSSSLTTLQSYHNS